MAVGSAISSRLGPASCDKDAALQFIEEPTRNGDLVPERVSAEILLRNANTEYPKGDRSPNLSAHPSPELPTSVSSDEAVSSTTRLKASISNAFHGVSTSLKKAAIKVGEPIYKARDFLLNRRGGGGGGGRGGGEGGHGEEGDVRGGDGEEGDMEGGGGDKKKLRPTPKMLQLIATTTIANTAQTFGSAISLKVSGLTFSSKILLILVMATGLAGYLFSITAILLMHKRSRFSHVWVWTGCAATALGLLILIVIFVLEL